MIESVWPKLYEGAFAAVNPRTVSPFVEAGGVGAAVLTRTGNIYTGVCIDAACGLGMCAERNALAHMLTCGENGVVKLLCVGSGGRLMPPCGSCREFLMQLDPAGGDLEIAMGREPFVSVKLRDLLPGWWGEGR